MTDTSLDDLGPVDYLVVEFPAGASNFTGEMKTELLALVDTGTIRVIDILILTKDADGAVDAMELSDIGELGELQALEAQLAELLAEDDVEQLAASMEPGGAFAMGSENFYLEEAPVRRVEVEGFWIDARPVTVGQFRRFVKQTGYVTVAERPLDPALFPDADPTMLVPGSLVFQPARGPVDLSDFRNWWSYVPGARWDRPEGPQSDTYTRGRHPVTQVAYEDAEAYAAWVGKALPTDAEWEYAARGGLDSKVFAWGDELAPDGRMLANSWQGEFPWQNLMLDGFAGTSPVEAFPPNGYGLFDMTGNVWEWTQD